MNKLRESIRSRMRQRWLRRHGGSFADHGAPRRPRLLVDVSVIARNDARTGIQRVVRSVWSHLSLLHSDGFDVVPVHASQDRGYCFSPVGFLSEHKGPGNLPVGMKSGDIFLGLDLAAHNLPKWSEQIDCWRTNGASVHIVVYDLLPLSHPAWFSPATGERFAAWLDSIVKRADQLLCISDEVAGELRQLLERIAPDRRPRIGRLHLSGDVAGSVPSVGLSARVEQTLKLVRANPTVLMVGTVEPRKAYDRAISAFELLWKSSADAPSLLIIGRPGWKTAKLQDDIRKHPELGRRLHWLQEASDEALDHAYTAARAVLIASYAEGFGLPLAEAAMHRRWTLVRDLPVFREQCLPNVHYFTDDSARSLARSIETITCMAKEEQPARANIPHWSSCVDKLIGEIGLGERESPMRKRQLVAAP